MGGLTPTAGLIWKVGFSGGLGFELVDLGRFQAATGYSRVLGILGSGMYLRVSAGFGYIWELVVSGS
jgi:hypothetical protein